MGAYAIIGGQKIPGSAERRGKMGCQPGSWKPIGQGLRKTMMKMGRKARSLRTKGYLKSLPHVGILMEMSLDADGRAGEEKGAGRLEKRES